jgi:hypothetical protein
MDIKMDKIDDFALDQSVNRIDSLLNDIRFLSAEHEEFGVETMAVSAMQQLETVKYIINEARKEKAE